MRKNIIPPFVGVIVSFVAIWLVNDLFLVDTCIDQGGRFNYSTGQCVLANNDIHESALGEYLIAVYFFMGLLVALFVSFSLRKLFNIDQ